MGHIINKLLIGSVSLFLAANALIFLPGQTGGEAAAWTPQEPDCRPGYKLEIIFYAVEEPESETFKNAVQTQMARLVDSMQYCEISTFKIQGFSPEYNSAVNETTSRLARIVADELKTREIDDSRITIAGPAVTPIFPQYRYGGREETDTYIEVLLHERHAD